MPTLTRRSGFVRRLVLVIAQHVHVGFVQRVPLPVAVRSEASPAGATASCAASRRMVGKIGHGAIILEHTNVTSLQTSHFAAQAEEFYNIKTDP